MQRALVVSIHDVAPSTQARVERILAQLAQHGVSVCSLLVVPDYHHEGRSLDDSPFRRWLEQLAGNGHEIVIHGYFHQRPRQSDESVRDKLATRFYTAGEGEFFDLGYADALRLICTARKEFESYGFSPLGFIAPAWLLGAEAERAAIDAGMNYTTTLRTVRDFTTGRTFSSQSLVYSVRSAWRRPVSLAWNRSLFLRQSNNPLLRLGIHPPDIVHRAIWRQIGGLIDKALSGRQPMTYIDWLDQATAISPRRSEMA